MPIIKRRSWGFQNTPNLQSLDDFEPSYGNLKKRKDCQKLVWYSILRVAQFFCCFLSQNSFKLSKLGVFRNPQELLLMMGTEILKIDAEMAEKIEVEVGNTLFKSDRMTGKWFLCWKCPFQLQLFQSFLEQLSKSQCPSSRGDPEDSKTPPLLLQINYQVNFGKLQFPFNCNNFAQNNPIFKSWGCFGIKWANLNDPNFR